MKMFQKSAIAFILQSLFFSNVSGHGRMIDPVQRSSLWRFFPGEGFQPNYNDNELFCGGFQRQWEINDGKCGTCGDPYDGERKNEAGGVYAREFIAKRYKKGEDIEVEIDLTANHLGNFQFKICPHNDWTSPVSQECLDQHVLEIAGQPGVTKYEPGSKVGSHLVKLALPADMTCEQCVLQWHYTSGNNNGCDRYTNECCKGCGPQETFMNCADVAIDDGGNGGNQDTKTTTKAPTTMRPTTRAPTSSKPLTSAPSTAKPVTKAPTTDDHNPTCVEDEVLDCIGVGIYDGLGFEGWCNSHCKARSAACTPDICQCHCRKPNCYAIGKHAAVPGMDQYCAENCINGCEDKSDLCECD